MKANRDTVMKIIVLVLAGIILLFTVIYLLTEWMIPGLLPLAQAALMVPMILIWNKQKQHRWISILFIVAAVLNLFAGIMQIITSI